MTFPTTAVNTTNLDSSSDSPANARADILDAVQKLNTIIAEANAANGVCVLTGSGKIPASTVPSQITLSAGVQVINPVDGVVNIRDILRLQTTTVADLTALTSQAGDVAYCEDGAGGNECLAFYDGTTWKRISVGATISAT
jgi:hypothetical protein